MVKLLPDEFRMEDGYITVKYENGLFRVSDGHNSYSSKMRLTTIPMYIEMLEDMMKHSYEYANIFGRSSDIPTGPNATPNRYLDCVSKVVAIDDSYNGNWIQTNRIGKILALVIKAYTEKCKPIDINSITDEELNSMGIKQLAMLLDMVERKTEQRSDCVTQ
jgi:hypothetical protein